MHTCYSSITALIFKIIFDTSKTFLLQPTCKICSSYPVLYIKKILPQQQNVNTKGTAYDFSIYRSLVIHTTENFENLIHSL